MCTEVVLSLLSVLQNGDFLTEITVSEKQTVCRFSWEVSTVAIFLSCYPSALQFQLQKWMPALFVHTDAAKSISLEVKTW